MENVMNQLPILVECPQCGTAVKIETYNNGTCFHCGHTYSWTAVGYEGPENADGPHDYISWSI